MICSTNCSKLPPRPVGTGCKTTTRAGGISRLVFAACDIDFADITNPYEWAEYVRSGKISISPTVVGQKGKPNFNKKRLSSCQPETVVSMESSVTFQDFSADTTSASDYDYYLDIQENAALYQFGWITCEGLFYGFVSPIAVEIGDVIEDASTGNTYWDGTVSWVSAATPKPIKIANLVSILQGNFSQVLGFPTCPTTVTITPYGLVESQTLDWDINGTTVGYLMTEFYLGSTYQWFKDNNAIVGATSYMYTIDLSGPPDTDAGGGYNVKIYTPGCDTITLVANLDIHDARPMFTFNGTSLAVTAPAPGTFMYSFRDPEYPDMAIPNGDVSLEGGPIANATPTAITLEINGDPIPAGTSILITVTHISTQAARNYIYTV